MSQHKETTNDMKRLSLILVAMGTALGQDVAPKKVAPWPKPETMPPPKMLEEIAQKFAYSADHAAFAPKFALLQDFAFAQNWQLEKGSRDAERNYERGRRALDRQQWDEALAYFKEVAGRKAEKADAALYWKAYVEGKLNRKQEALASIAELEKSHPKSQWLNDAKALQVEISGGSFTAAADGGDDEIKLLALQGLVHSDPERAYPLIEKMLTSSQSPKVKERALFVLMQSGSPKARETVLRVAKGGGNPDVQLKAIQFLGSMGSKQELLDIYKSSADRSVKRSALRGFMASGAREQLYEIAKSEKDTELRLEAIRQLGAMGMRSEVAGMYSVELDKEIKRELMRSMFVSGNSEKLIEIAKAEVDADLRREAIRNLGVMKKSDTGDLLAQLYANEKDPKVRRTIIEGLFVQGNVTKLIELARAEKDPEVKKDLVQKLSHMKSKEATDYMLELLK